MQLHMQLYLNHQTIRWMEVRGNRQGPCGDRYPTAVNRSYEGALRVAALVDNGIFGIREMPEAWPV
jgi:hypothetical protein